MTDRVVHAQDLDELRGLSEDGSKAFVKVDGTTVKFNASGQLVAAGGGKLVFGATDPNVPGTGESEEWFVTTDGTSAGAILAQWIWDQESSAWLKRPTPLSIPTTTSLTPVVYDGSAFVGAKADAEANVADLIKLSDGTYLHTGKVTWTGHGLTVGRWYYLSQSMAGAYVTPEPTTGLSQQLFFVEDENTIHVDIEQAVNRIDDAGTAPTDFAKTVYVNATSPNAATIFDLANPPATNDDSLKADPNNIYIGHDSSTWTYNSSTSTYSTYVPPTTVPHGVLAYAITGLSIPNGAVQSITGYSTTTNTAGSGWNAATGEFTAQRAGWYDVSMGILFEAGNWAKGSQARAIITKNGNYVTSNSYFTHVAVSGSYVGSVTSTTKVYMNAGDVVRAQTYQNSGSAKLLTGGIYNTFSIVEMR